MLKGGRQRFGFPVLRRFLGEAGELGARRRLARQARDALAPSPEFRPTGGRRSAMIHDEAQIRQRLGDLQNRGNLRRPRDQIEGQVAFGERHHPGPNRR
jgi:hypothetical protein